MTTDRGIFAETSPSSGLEADEGGIRSLLREVVATQQRFERYLAQELRVDAPGLAVMNLLDEVSTATPTEIAHRLGMSTAATTLVLDRLEAAQHVSRSPHPDDRRKVVVTPAPASIDRALSLVSPMIDDITALTNSMTPGQRRTVSSFLSEVVAIYRRTMDGGGNVTADG